MVNVLTNSPKILDLRLRRPFSSQRPKHVLNTAEIYRKHFYPIASSIWEILNWKTSHLVRSEMLGMFVDILTFENKYSCYKRGNFPQEIKMQ